MLLLIPFSFLYLFLFYTFSFHSFTLSFYRTLYNLYLNPNLLKILSNYTYTISKVTTFTHLHSYFSYTLSCCAQTNLTIFGYLYYHFNCKHCIMPSYCAVLYLAIINFIGSSFRSLCNSALLCHYCAIVDHLLICLLL